jgi:ABC-type antimicrobial peptide transport system permease subunit
MLEGREFPPHPSQEPVAIINQELARRLFPGQNAVGRTFFHGNQPLRIIGVAANSKYQTLFEPETTPIFYRPLLDVYKGGKEEFGLTLLIKNERASASLGEVVRKKMLARDPELVVGDIATSETHIRESMILPRLAAILFGLCGGIGLLIASIGVYGVISFAVARRTKEIGIRMALGARASQVLGMVLKHGVAVSLIGIGFGIAAGMAISRVIGSLLFGVSAIDPLTFSCVAVLLFSVALLATAIPARRAVAIDPNQTLRAE